jgi:hypothetical protein
MCHASRQALLMQTDKEECHMLVWPNSETLSAHKSKSLLQIQRYSLKAGTRTSFASFTKFLHKKVERVAHTFTWNVHHPHHCKLVLLAHSLPFLLSLEELGENHPPCAAKHSLRIHKYLAYDS